VPPNPTRRGATFESILRRGQASLRDAICLGLCGHRGLKLMATAKPSLRDGPGGMLGGPAPPAATP